MNELELAEQKFEVLDKAPMGMCVIREDYLVLFWNRCLEDWSGIKKTEIVGTELYRHFPHFREPKYCSRVDTIFQGGPPAIFSSQLHKHIFPSPLKNGELRVQHTTVTSVPACEGSGFYALLAIEDVTELTRRIEDFRRMQTRASAELKQRKQTEEELRAANQKILKQQKKIIEEERLKVLLQMAGATAHQLNQPLMVLLGNVDLLKMYRDDPKKLAKSVADIEDAAKRIADIVRKIQAIRQDETRHNLGESSIINID